jgi:hypothetical protein
MNIHHPQSFQIPGVYLKSASGQEYGASDPALLYHALVSAISKKEKSLCCESKDEVWKATMVGNEKGAMLARYIHL